MHQHHCRRLTKTANLLFADMIRQTQYFVISHVPLCSFSLGISLDTELTFDIPLNIHSMPESICVH